MKNQNFKYLLITVILIAFTQCKKEEIKTLSVSITSKTVSKSEDGFTFAIYGNTDWTVSSNKSWCVVNQTSGSGNDNVSVSISANTTTSERNAIITINGIDVSSQTITVTQEAGDSPQSDEINVFNPFGSSNWYAGTSCYIEWEDNISEDVSIKLYKGSNFQETIINSTQSDGQYIWALPNNLSTGSNYKIKVTSVSNSSIYGYSSYFTITGSGNSGSIIFNPILTYGTMTDQDGNTYKTITIGSQTWMAENLRVTHFRNGDPIPNVTDNDTWHNLTSSAYCWYNNDISNKDIYGALYNWYAVTDSRNIAPAGWHVPTSDDMQELVDYLVHLKLVVK